MTGVEIAIGYVFAWAVRKARRVAGRADAEVDLALDGAMDRVHGVVARRLGDDSELERLEAEAAAGQEEPSALTRQRVEAAVSRAVEQDAGFARDLDEAVAAVQEAARAAGGAVAGAYGLAVGGDLSVTAEGGSFAAGVANIRDGVRLGNPQQPGTDRS
ncbi:hypothetical protein [Streptomyces sp. NBC_00986]|uniref:hypothetical protein n=1 Tax=Streptomyces sp. NBC_00986 TaxID=2903702 RepID=UPI00386FE6BC|nr:hypothetical protein OG504_28010 [Streptomyces sp. NBC_00986]